VLIAAGVGLSVFGFQQSILWGWGNPGTWACIVGGLLLIGVFVVAESKTVSPLVQVAIFRIRAFSVENVVLGVSMVVFIPVFFFASEYAQIALGKSASQAGLYLLYFFIGFAIAAQVGGRMLDRAGAKRPVVLGGAIAAIGFGLWASRVVQLDFSTQTWPVIIAGAGMGLLLGPANTDAINRASRLSYGEATGITQTVRNYGASLGLAVLGTILLTVERSHLTPALARLGVPHAASVSKQISESRSAPTGVVTSSAQYRETLHAVQLSFAQATRVVLWVMAGVMALAAVVALVGLEAGRQEEVAEPVPTDPGDDAPAPSGPGGPMVDR
jgi:hypothetical protein